VVLVLNQSYEPLNVCNLPRAFRLVFGQKAEVLEYDDQVIRTPRQEYRAPSVIRLQHQIRASCWRSSPVRCSLASVTRQPQASESRTELRQPPLSVHEASVTRHPSGVRCSVS
jgi:hypothetical protein